MVANDLIEELENPLDSAYSKSLIQLAYSTIDSNNIDQKISDYKANAGNECRLGSSTQSEFAGYNQELAAAWAELLKSTSNKLVITYPLIMKEIAFYLNERPKIKKLRTELEALFKVNPPEFIEPNFGLEVIKAYIDKLLTTEIGIKLGREELEAEVRLYLYERWSKLRQYFKTQFWGPEAKLSVK